MSADRHEQVAAMLGEYALGHLSPGERREVDAHVSECAACTAELREFTALMDVMAHTPEPVAPPPALRRQVLDRFVADRGGVAARRTDDPRTWAWAAAAVLVIGVGATMYVAADRRADAALRATIADLERRLEDYAGQTDLAVSILTASDMQPVPMEGLDRAAASAARAYFSRTRGLLIVADRLPTPPPGRVYQVWIIGEGASPSSAGLLGAPGTGRGILIATPPAGLAAGTVTVAVTDEPPGGLPAPSGAMHLRGSV